MLKPTSQKRELFARTLKEAPLRVFAFVLVFGVLTGVLSIVRPLTVDASAANTINFQARLENSNGSIAADGTYNVEFKLYDAATGGSALWTEDYLVSNSQGIQVTNGYLTTNLGSITAFPGSIDWSQQLYVTMNIGGTGSTPSWDGEMVNGGGNRMALTAVPYAFAAQNLINNSGSYSSSLKLPTATGGAQTFQLQDQGAAGTYNLCIQGSTACGFAPVTGGSGYVQLQGSTPGSQQTGDFNITGSGIAGTLQAGTFDTAAAGTLNLGTANATTITVGRSGINMTVNGNITTAGTYNSNTFTSSSLTFGATSAAAIQSASGQNLSLQGGSTSTTLSNIGFSVQDSTNSGTAFQVQNANGAPVFLVDTTTNNYIVNSGFEVNTTGWASNGSATLTQNVNKANTYHGVASLQVATTALANDGARVSSFTTAPTFATSATWELSFYAKLSSGTFTTLQAGYNVGAGDVTCTLSSATVSTSGFNRYTCTITLTSGQTISSVFIRQSDATARTFWVDAVQLNTGSTILPYQIGNVQLRGVVTNPATFQSSSNSTTAFQVLNAAGTGNNFVVDTLNSQVRVNTGGFGAGFNVGSSSVFRSNSTSALQVQNNNATPLLSVDTSTTASNLITNPGFEANTTGWTNKTGGTLTRITTPTSAMYYGVAAGNLAMTAANGGVSYATTLTLGSTYTLSFYARSSSGTLANVNVGYTNTGGDQDCLTNQTIVATGFTRFTCTFTVSGTAGTAIYVKENSTVTETVYLDAFQLLAANSQTPYWLGKIQLRGVVSSPIVFQNDNDSTTAFQIQNASGTNNLFMADTLNSRIGIGTGTPSQRLDVQGGNINTSGSIMTGGTTRIDNAGTLSNVTYQGTAIGGAYGGTGQSSYTVGDLLYASGATTLSKLSDVATGSCLISGGIGVAPSWGSCTSGGGISGTGTANTIPLFTNTSTVGNSILTQSGTSYINIAGDLQLANNVDTSSATSLNLGATNANAVRIGHSSINTIVNGQLQLASGLDTSSATGLNIGGTNATSINLNAQTAIASTGVTTGNAFSVTMNSLTSGNAITAVTNSTSQTSSGSLFFLNQQYASGTAVVARLQQAGTGDMLDFQNGSGSVIASVTSAGNLQVASSVDTASAATLNIGLTSGGNTTGIALNQNTTVASGKTFYIGGTPPNTTQAFILPSSSTTRGLIIQGASGQSVDLLDFYNSSNNFVSGFDANGNLFMNGSATFGTTSTIGSIGLKDGTTNNRKVTLNTIPLSANQTITLPDATGTVCLQNSSSCGFQATGSYETTTGTDFIQNQTGSQQTANFNISGFGAANSFRSSTFGSFDQNSTNTSSVSLVSGNATGATNNSGNITVDNGSVVGGTAGTLSLGTANASSITIGHSSINTIINGVLGINTSSPQSGSAITITNGSWLTSTANGGGYINMFQVNSSNEIQVGAALNVDGGIVLPTDGGQLTFSDLPIDSSATAGTPESYTLRVGSTNALTVYGEADGSGNSQNVRVAVGGSITPAYTLDVGGDINTSTQYRINGTAGASVTCSGGQFLQNQVVAGGIVTGGTCANASGSGSGVTSIGALDTAGFNTSSNGATISGTTLYLQSATASVPGLVNTGTQTFAGAKTFNGSVTVNAGTQINVQAGSTPGLIIQANNSQTGDFFQILGSDGVTVVDRIDSNGNLTLGSNLTVTAGTLQANKVDTASAGALTIGSTNATSIVLSQNTTIATNKSLSLQGSVATSTLLSTIVSGDTNQRLTVGADGTLSWGPGNAATDVSLNRAAANTLSVSDTLGIGNKLVVGGTAPIAGVRMTVYPLYSGVIGEVIRASSSQNLDLFELQANGGGVLDSFNANGDLQVGGASSAASGTAFQIQNTAGTAILLADTGNNVIKVGTTANATQAGTALFMASAEVSGALRIGNATNNVQFDATTHEMILSGTARHTKAVTLTAEYAGAVLDAGTGSNNSGTMTSAIDLTNRETYYKWVTTQSTSNSYDVDVMIPIPSDFSGWASSTPMTIDTYTPDTTNGTIQLEVRDSNNTVETNENFASITPSTASTWTTITPGSFGGTYNAGGYMTLRIRMNATSGMTNSSQGVRIGNIKLTYLTKW